MPAFLKIFTWQLVLLGISINLTAQKITAQRVFSKSTPESQGISSAILDSLLHILTETNQNIHHLTIIRNKVLVLDTDFYPYSSDYLHDIASCTKSITSLLIGIAIDKGFIKDENQKVLQFFPDFKSSNRLLDSLTVKDLLSMRSGFDCSVEGGEQALSNMRKSEDWVNFIFNLPMLNGPGEKFSYCSCNNYLLSEIIYRTTKLTAHEFAKRWLFAPLDISGTTWLANKKGINHGWGDLFLRPGDMEKIGQMVLDKGIWEGNRVVSEHWIIKSLQTISKIAEDKGYGYGWWTNDKVGFYEAAGRGRQTISVIPSRNMVVIMLGGEFDAGIAGNYIFKAIKADQSLPENPAAYNQLKSTLETITIAPKRIPATMNKSIIQKLDKRMIVFEKNLTTIDSVQFNFGTSTSGKVRLYKNKMTETYPMAFSTNTYSLGIDPVLKLPVATMAYFQDNEFVLHFNQLNRINNFYFHFVVKGDKVTTTIEETTNSFTMNVGTLLR